MDEVETIESIRALLAEIVDYAGLFPPSKLPMTEAVTNYAAYLESNYKWMLGRFVVPVARLDEFAENAEKFFEKGEDVWKLSVLGNDEIDETVEKIASFNEKFAGKAIADALEVKAADTLEIENITAHLPEKLPVYFELPLDEKLADSIIALAIHKHRAKIRTGGVTPDAFPPVDKITRFMRLCLAANVPFKCTAGLHHPLRCQKTLTYEANAPTGRMNGFLNVFLAAAFLQQGYEPRLIHELLREERADNFQFRADGVLWRQEYFAHTTQLRFLREHGIISFGSCSFIEPIEDLQEMGIL
ncbi:MAG: hypothetical protein LH472_06675 [Pyrinomonadaceae bacterium]|nr:hypothetical protein [Pyrinomonadaceae bacterium]